MDIKDLLIQELIQESAATRRVLERVPEDKLTWRPHPKSMTLGQLALHVATSPSGTADFLSEPIRETPSFTTVEPASASVAEILSAHDKSTEIAAAALSSWGEDGLNAEWKMMRGEETLFALPRLNMVRSIMFNHSYHHRGQLSVYLRLLDVPLPSIYGPSAEESPF